MPEPVSSPRTCGSCGHVSTVEDRVCPRCGATLPGLSATERLEISRAPTFAAQGDAGLAAHGAPTSPETAGAPAAGPDALAEQLSAALSPGFLLVRKLGQGGMASVYLAREPALRRLVAVKVLSPTLALEPSARARFEREAQAVAGLSHPNVLGIHGLGELDDGTPYFVMQYVSGRSLAARLEEEGPLDPDEARRIVGEVAAALAAAHAKGIVHRDIKPANILYDDESGRALVSDFGIAAVRREGGAAGAEATRLTGTGMMVGTPQYMSPEQMLAEPVTEKTDVYALGLLGYELVAGHGPFRATTPQELIAAHLRDVPQPLGDTRKEVDPEFAGLVAACLEKDAARRPKAADVAKRLAPGGGMPLEWPPPGLDALHGDLRRWSVRLWVASALVVGAALAFLSRGLPRAGEQAGRSLAQLLGLVAIAGVVAALVAARRITTGARIGALAVRRGYTWLTVLETLADTRGDTGALIVGSREYASLAPPVRGGLRRGRVLREALLFAGGLAPLLLLPVAMRAGPSRALSADAAQWFFAVPALLLLLGGVALEHLERRVVGEARRAARHRRGAGDDTVRLVDPWYLSFEASRAGQAMGRGRPGGARLGRASGLALALGTAVLATTLLPVWLVGVLGPRFMSVFFWSTGETLRSGFMAEARALALPLDSSIAPLAAGRALVLLEEVSRDVHEPSQPSPIPELPQPTRLPPLPRAWPADSRDSADLWLGCPNPGRVLEQALSGFTPAQLQWLRALDAHPAWAAYRRVATAPAVDYFGARFRLPLPDGVTPDAMMTRGGFGLRWMAWRNTARAALRLAEGRPADAERVLRETVSLGLRLLEEGWWAGSGIVVEGRRGLAQLARLTGRQLPALAGLGEAALTAPASADTAAGTYARTGSPRRSTLAAARDTTRSRQSRLWLLGHVAFLPCTNVRELVFGPDEDLLATFDEARLTLSRFPSDTARLDALEHFARGTTIHRAASADQASLSFAVGSWAGRVSARILGVPRISTCFDSYLQYLRWLF